ncbi:MAG: hypothetical protein WCP72_00165 [Desulfomonile sp.]|jgi:hypothetical protein
MFNIEPSGYKVDPELSLQAVTSIDRSRRFGLPEIPLVVPSRDLNLSI